MKFFYFFIFLVCIAIVSGYYPGEKLNVSYSDILSVSYPCLLINHSVYISGDVNVGSNECAITYYDYYEQTEISTSSSRSGGAICTYTSCINNKKIGVCRKGGIRYNITMKCTSNITLNITIPINDIIITSSKEQYYYPQELLAKILINQTNQTYVNINHINESSNTTKRETKEPNYLLIILVSFGVVFLLGMCLFIYFIFIK